jgi:hypothetical protein
MLQQRSQRTLQLCQMSIVELFHGMLQHATIRPAVAPRMPFPAAVTNR